MKTLNNQLTLCLCMLLFQACDNNSSIVENPQPIDFPLYFALSGSVEGKSEKKNVECDCHQIGELSPNYTISKDTTIYSGTMGGHVSRTVLDNNGNGISLVPDLFGEILVKLHKDSVWVITPINSTSESRFYKNIAVFKGTKKGEVITGKWKCAPFDISESGWVDLVGSVEGDWEISVLD